MPARTLAGFPFTSSIAMALITELWERCSLPWTMRDADRMKLCRMWVLVVCACGFAANLSAQRITGTIKDDWPTYNGDYTGRRFSSLTQITSKNAAHLQAQWVFHTKTPGVLE